MLATRDYAVFRTKYKRLLRSAKSVMDTPYQRQVLDGVAGTAFQAGFDAGRQAALQPAKEVKLKPWKAKPTTP